MLNWQGLETHSAWASMIAPGMCLVHVCQNSVLNSPVATFPTGVLQF